MGGAPAAAYRYCRFPAVPACSSECEHGGGGGCGGGVECDSSVAGGGGLKTRNANLAGR